MDFIYILEIIGISVFSISGFLAARENDMDLFGAIVISFITALGGGTLRDLLLDTKIVWMENELFIYVAIFTSLLAYFFANHLHHLRKTLKLYDAIGLGVFAILGVERALFYGENYTVAIILGVVSASFGGVLRDVLCNRIPLLFQREIYGTAAVIGCSFFILMHYFNIDNNILFVLSCLVITTIRLLAVRFNFKLPFLNGKI